MRSTMLPLVLAIFFFTACSKEDKKGSLSKNWNTAILSSTNGDDYNSDLQHRKEFPSIDSSFEVSNGSKDVSDDGSSAPAGATVESYNCSLKALQDNEFQPDSLYSSHLRRLGNGVLVLGLPAEFGNESDASWNIYWIDPNTLEVKNHVATNSALRMLHIANGEQVLTLDSAGNFSVYGLNAELLYAEVVPKPYPDAFIGKTNDLYGNVDHDLFVSAAGRVYFKLDDSTPIGGKDHRIWDPDAKTLVKGASDFLPDFELDNGQLVAVDSSAWGRRPTILTLAQNLAIEDRMHLPNGPKQNRVTYAKLLANNNIVVEITDAMDLEKYRKVYEIDFINKKVVQSLPSVSPKGQELRLFALSKPFLTGSFLAFDLDSQPAIAVVFDENGAIFRSEEMEEGVSRIGLGRSFSIIENGSKLLFPYGILEIQSFDLMNILECRHGAADKIYNSSNGAIIGGNSLGLSILEPSK